MVKCFVLILMVILTTLLNSCGGYPRLLKFPFDRGGRGLNSLSSELTPQVTSSYIIFVSDRNGSQDVYLFDAQERQLINLPGLNSFNEVASHPSISEDGRYIVFATSRQGKSNICLYDRQNQQKRSITKNIQAEVRNPMINAGGDHITFEIAQDGQWDIMIYNLSENPI